MAGKANVPSGALLPCATTAPRGVCTVIFAPGNGRPRASLTLPEMIGVIGSRAAAAAASVVLNAVVVAINKIAITAIGRIFVILRKKQQTRRASDARHEAREWQSPFAPIHSDVGNGKT